MPNNKDPNGTPKSALATPRATRNGKVANAGKPGETVRYFASIYPGPKSNSEIPKEFASLVKSLEHELHVPIWLVVQQGEKGLNEIGDELVFALVKASHDLPEGKCVALLVDSAGGYAESAYRVARLVQRHCRNFIAIVPRYAKSAATLLVLGAQKIFMGLHAELGPLDAQLYDPDREEFMSALDEVQSLDRLNVFSLDAIDKTMILLTGRTAKKTEKLLPLCLDFVAKISVPLFDQIDAIHYTKMSRILKEAEEYAIRLLSPRYSDKDARRIARLLVEHYPQHGFVIDSDEAKEIGLAAETPQENVGKTLDAMYHYLDECEMQQRPLTIIGRIEEVTS